MNSLERDQPTSRLPQPFRELFRKYSDAVFACGEWTNDDDEPYEQVHDDVVAAEEALVHALLPLLPKEGA